MQILTRLEQIGEYAGGVVTIGNFDGVHRGHAAMLRVVKQMADRLSVPAVAMTFDPPPVALIAPERVPPRLSTVTRKAELMDQLGIDALLVYPTHRDFLDLSAEQFFNLIIQQQLQARGIVEGENFCFGKNRVGTSESLRQYCIAADIEVEIISSILDESETISSTRIRQHIQRGELRQAVELLGHPYQMSGIVVKGAQRGRLLGFPTANLSEIPTLIPSPGVYAGFCERNGQRIPAAVHIGPNPTFDDNTLKVEIHLIHYQADLYGESLAVNLLFRIRSIREFKDKDALQNQLHIDINTTVDLVDVWMTNID